MSEPSWIRGREGWDEAGWEPGSQGACKRSQAVESPSRMLAGHSAMTGTLLFLLSAVALSRWHTADVLGVGSDGPAGASPDDIKDWSSTQAGSLPAIASSR